MTTDPRSAENLKGLLLDLAKEADGGVLDSVFEVNKFTFKLRLPSEEEMNWCYRFMNPANTVTVATSMRLPILAIAIREINGLSIEEFFASEWEGLSATEKSFYENANKFSKKYFAAEHLMQFLGQRPPAFIQSLWANYEELSKRRKIAGDEIKNSSGEGSEKAEKKSLTEPSLIGDPSVTASK